MPAAGDGGTAGWHAAVLLDPATALARDLGAAFPGDRAGHAAAVGEHLVRGVDDRIDLLISDVALDDAQGAAVRTQVVFVHPT